MYFIHLSRVGLLLLRLLTLVTFFDLLDLHSELMFVCLEFIDLEVGFPQFCFE